MNDKTTYSNDEIVIGSYFGKPLYRKVVKVQTTKQISVDNWEALGITISNISQLVRADLSFYTGVFGFQYYNGLNIIASIPGFVISPNHNIVVEYTKTTD